MNNPEIDFKAMFGDGFYQPSPSAVPGVADNTFPCPGAPPCPPLQEATLVTEPLEPVCTCTPGEAAYHQGAEDMRESLRVRFERMWDEDVCRCYRCLKDLFTGDDRDH